MNAFKFLRPLGYLLTAALLVHFIYEYSDELLEIRLEAAPAVIGVLLGGVVLLLRAFAFHFLFLELGGKKTFFFSAVVLSKTTLLNQIYPTRIGSLYLINEIKKLGILSISQATAMYGGSAVVSLLATLVLAVIGSLWVTALPTVAWIGLVLTIVVILSVLMFGGKVLSGKLSELWHDLTFFLKKPSGKPFILLSTLELIVMTLCMQQFYSSLGIELGIADGLVLMGIRNLSLLLAVTPGAMGLSEVTVGYVSSFLQHGGAAGITVALLLRVTLLAFSGLLWLLEIGAKVSRR